MRAYIELCIDTENTNDPSTSHPTVKIEMPVPCNSIDSVYENLVKPALEASGFNDVDKAMESYFGGES
jgi:hypothetical protein